MNPRADLLTIFIALALIGAIYALLGSNGIYGMLTGFIVSYLGMRAKYGPGFLDD